MTVRKWDVIVLGSGSSGAMAASTLVKKGLSVCIVDGGNEDLIYKNRIPDESFSWIKKNDSAQRFYFVGANGEGVPSGKVRVGAQLTPPRQFITENTESLPYQSDSFFPMQSLALGGLAAGWGAACFTYSDTELRRIGIYQENFQKYYREVATEIGISGDLTSDCAPFSYFGIPETQPPLKIDTNGEVLLGSYEKKRELFNSKGLYLGRPNLAILSRDMGTRKANPYFDMDFWGDSRGSVYRPKYTIETLRGKPNFEYFPGILGIRFEKKHDEKVVLYGRDLKSNRPVQFEADRLVLAGGAINSARMVANSLNIEQSESPILCNPYTYFPTVQLRMLGRKNSDLRHSLSQLVGVFRPKHTPDDLVSLQFYSYRSLLLFKLVKDIPLPPWIGLRVARLLVSSLVIVGVHHRDFPGITRRMVVGNTKKDDIPVVSFRYSQTADEVRKIAEIEKTVRNFLQSLGCISFGRVNPGHASSIHYAGTIPSAGNIASSMRSDSFGRLEGCKNVYLADSSTWNELPAKGLTLTLMANAKRVAENLVSDWEKDKCRQ